MVPVISCTTRPRVRDPRRLSHSTVFSCTRAARGQCDRGRERTVLISRSRFSGSKESVTQCFDTSHVYTDRNDR